MSEELKLQESVKKTQELLGKYIKKPPLTDKLLKKPPFRFLHDIINAIIKETDFLKHLFTDEESNSNNIKDKDAKLLYLNKLIDAVKLITGHELSVRPSKIISGQEPIKTNEFLQVIGRALDKKVSSTEAIEYYKKNLEKKEGLKNKSIEINQSKDEKIKKSGTKSESKPSSKEKTRDKDDKTKRESKPASKETKIRDKSIDKRESKSKDTKKKEISATDVPKRRRSQVSTEKRGKIDEKKTTHSAISSNEIRKSEVMSHAVISDELVKDTKINEDEVVVDDKYSSPPVEEHDEMIIEKVNDDPKEVILSPSESELNNVKKSEDKLITDVVTAKTTVGLLRPPSARPPSARPAAPRIRSKPDFIINNSGINQMPEVNVIIENFDTRIDDDDDGDGDDMVVMETAANNDSLTLGGTTDLLSNQLTQEHGYLVAQILDTQRELVNESNVELIPNKVEIEWEAGLKKDRDVIVKEIDKLRGTIQSLTRTTNPLGKLLDFLQEDAEIMEKELQDWRIQYNNVHEQLIIERNMTTESLKPLEESLKDVESSIVNQMEKIFQTKANIMKNNLKIQRLLSGK